MKSLSEQNHYEALELAPGATGDAIERAYAKAKEAYGPGSLATYALAEPSEAAAVLKRVEEAYASLSDPERRKAYDAEHGWAAPPPAAAKEAGKEGEVQASEPTLPPGDPKLEAPQTASADASPATPSAAPAAAAPEAPQETPPKETSAKEASKEAPPKEAPPKEAPREAKPEVTEPAVAIPAAPPPSASSPTDPSGFAPGIAPAPAPSAAAVSPPASHAEAPPSETRSTPPPSSLSPPPPTVGEKPVRKTEAELAPDGPVTGEALKRVREARGLSLKDLEARTKIGHWHLDSIERERYSGLPAHVYLRGFLMSLARELKLDPVRVSKSYLEQMKAKQAEKAEKP